MYSPSFARSGRPLCFLMALSYFTFLIEQAKCLTTIDWIFFIDINFRLRKHVEKGAVMWWVRFEKRGDCKFEQDLCFGKVTQAGSLEAALQRGDQLVDCWNIPGGMTR